jgi:beta-phosphoglucomutase-like phosphatase (HAD superfamily)
VKIEALIFDVDGTLADTEEAHRQSFNDAFRAHELDFCWSRVVASTRRILVSSSLRSFMPRLSRGWRIPVEP